MYTIIVSCLRSELRVWLDYQTGMWQAAILMVQVMVPSAVSLYTPRGRSPGHFSEPEWGGTLWFVIESNLFSFTLAVGFPFAHGLCPFFRGAFTGQVP